MRIVTIDDSVVSFVDLRESEGGESINPLSRTRKLVSKAVSGFNLPFRSVT